MDVSEGSFIRNIYFLLAGNIYFLIEESDRYLAVKAYQKVYFIRSSKNGIHHDQGLLHREFFLYFFFHFSFETNLFSSGSQFGKLSNQKIL